MIARLSQALRQHWQLLALAALVGLATAFVVHFGLRYHTQSNDELAPVYGARHILDNFPSALWASDTSPRGPERLTAFVLAIINAVVGPTATEFSAAHIVLALAWALVTIPVYALGRGLGLASGAALLIAAVAVLNPYALYAATFLNTTLGYLTFTALLYAMWRTTVRPSISADIGVLVAFAFVTTARVSYAPLVAALIPALLVQSWRDRPAGARLGSWLKQLPAELWRRHRVLVLAGVLGLALLAVKGRSGIVGGYGADAVGSPFEISLLWDNLKVVFARMAESLAFIPVALALPWLVIEAVRPRSRESGAFAVLGLATIAIYFYVFLIALVEDRYSVVLVPVILLAFGCALFRGQVSRVGVAITSAALVAIMLAVGRFPSDDPYSYFIAPGAQFFKRVLLNKLVLVLPAGDTHVFGLAVVGFAVCAVLLALCLHRSRRTATIATALACAVVLAYSAVAAGYAAKKFTDQAGMPTLTFEQQTFVDRVAGERSVGRLTVDPANSTDRQQAWTRTEYFNGSVEVSVARDGVAQVPCCSRHGRPSVSLHIDERGGAVRTTHGPLPPLLLVPTGWLPWGLNWTTTASTPHDMLRVEQLPSNPRVAFVSLGGTYPDGWIKPGRAERLRVFPGPDRRSCLYGTVEVASPVPPRPVRVTIAGEGVGVLRSLPAGGAGPLQVELTRRPAQELRVSAEPAGPLPDGRRASARVGDLRLAPCPA